MIFNPRQKVLHGIKKFFVVMVGFVWEELKVH